ncbi:MAG TPA: fasciclin domain-containing protein [Micromonospora sp.]|nr:fasciclin domain-containing protein [Micromonospora sp.]
MNKLRGFAAAAAVIAGVTLVAGCSGSDTASQAGSGTTGASPSGSPSATAGAAEAAGPFGPSCPKLPASGPGSAASLASEPVATAAAQTPALSTLVTAVTSAGLANTLNSADGITLFAPTNDAFAKIPKATLAKVLADKKTLSGILTYHVVGERRAPIDLTAGTLPTLEGGNVAIEKTGDAYTVNDARVLCGNLQTRNATVYLIDTVLMPTA